MHAWSRLWTVLLPESGETVSGFASFLWPARKFVYLQSIMMNCWQQLPSRWNIYQNLSSLFASSRTAGFICNTVRGQPASANLGGNQMEGVVERNPISPLTTPSIKI